MYRLSSIIFLLFAIIRTSAQSPHGESLKIDCAVCHNSTGWTVNTDSIRYNHDDADFKLSGTHTTTDCKSCHITSIFTEAPSQCSSCHTDVHNMSVGNDCSRCHTTQNWLVDNIPELHEESGFALVGAHTGLSCVDCHTSETNLRFDRIGNECTNCHMNDFLSTKNPDHKKNGLSTNCIECHDPISTNWDSDNFNHDFFPLTFGHAINECNLCHNGNYTSTPNTCNGCHMPDYTATTNPNHSAVQFPTNCAVCHNETAWAPSSFNHNSFPIVGAHTAITNCNDCHHGNYTITPNTCAGCHMPDYDATTNPNHSTALFSTDCTICHTQSGWTPSSFDHDAQYFPIYSGKHDGEWNSCTDCHTNSGNYAIFSCVDCHEHDNQTSVNNDHSGVSGYSYNSNACLTCHPDGN